VKRLQARTIDCNQPVLSDKDLVIDQSGACHAANGWGSEGE
jgi:hypothetical protein